MLWEFIGSFRNPILDFWKFSYYIEDQIVSITLFLFLWCDLQYLLGRVAQVLTSEYRIVTGVLTKNLVSRLLVIVVPFGGADSPRRDLKQYTVVRSENNEI